MKRIAMLGCAALFLDCGPPSIEEHLDASWSGREAAVIHSAMAEWNTKAGERLQAPGPVFILAGSWSGEYSKSVIKDGRSVVYRWMTFSVEGVGGRGVQMGDDVFLFVRPMWGCLGYFTPSLKYAQWCEPYSYPPDSDGTEEDRETGLEELWRGYERRLWAVAAHELGHRLGLKHLDEMHIPGPGIMDAAPPDAFGGVKTDHLFEADLEAFCRLYVCR